MSTQFRVAGGSIQSQLYQTCGWLLRCYWSEKCFEELPFTLYFLLSRDFHSLYFVAVFVFCMKLLIDDTDPRISLLWRAFTNYFLLFPDFHSSLETIMTSSLSFTVSTAASLSKQYMIYANNFWRKKCWTMHQVLKWNKSFATNLCNRVAELGSLSSGAKMAMKIFVKRVFTIFASNASFLCVIANLQN